MGDTDWEQKTGRKRLDFQIGKRILEVTGGSFRLRTKEGKEEKGRFGIGTGADIPKGKGMREGTGGGIQTGERRRKEHVRVSDW